MDWERSKAVTPLKREFLLAFFKEEQRFYLTGGTALGAFYLQHRLSNDLDLFTQEEVDWHLLENLVRSVAEAISAECETLTASPQFRRFVLTRGDDREVVDFVIDKIPQIDHEKERFGSIRVDTLREIMVNKVCTLVSRCELKDLIDLYFLHQSGHEVEANFSDAQRKEGGLEPAIVSFLLSQVSVNELPEYVLAPLEIDDLRAFIRDLEEAMARRALPE